MRVLAERLKNAGKFDFCVNFPGRSLSWGDDHSGWFCVHTEEGSAECVTAVFSGVLADGNSGPADHVGGVLQWAVSAGWR